MKQIASPKRNTIVTLNTDATTLTHSFKAGDKLKFLSLFNNGLVRLSRVGDCAKLIVVDAHIDYARAGEGVEETAAQYSEGGKDSKQYDSAHSDASGPSREIVIATVLAGPDSGRLTMHLTPDEEREYNRGMAELAQWG